MIISLDISLVAIVLDNVCLVSSKLLSCLKTSESKHFVFFSYMVITFLWLLHIFYISVKT